MGDRPLRAIEARRLQFTPELLANVRRRYEQSDEPLSALAADLGCSHETVRNIARREGWRRFVRPPRELSSAARLKARAEALACPLYPPLEGEGRERSERGGVSNQERSPPPDRGRFATAVDLPPPGGGEDREARMGGGEENASPPAQNDTVPASAQPPQVADTAEQLHCELQGLLVEVRATRERMKREFYGKHDLREISQVIANLTTTLRTLQPLLCPVPQAGADDDAYDDMPADIDEFRHELARRIRAFVASRADRGDAQGDAGEPVD